jgi:hypothetical protein
VKCPNCGSEVQLSPYLQSLKHADAKQLETPLRKGERAVAYLCLVCESWVTVAETIPAVPA